VFLERAPGLWTEKLWLRLIGRTYEIIGQVNTLWGCSEYGTSGWLRAAVVRCGGATGDGQLPVKYHFSFFPDFSHISKVPRRINPFKTKICIELEVFQVVTSCRIFLSCYRSFGGTQCTIDSGSCDPRRVLRDSYWKRRNYTLPKLRKLSTDTV
jgi:hypothetical protein